MSFVIITVIIFPKSCKKAKIQCYKHGRPISILGQLLQGMTGNNDMAVLTLSILAQQMQNEKNSKCNNFISNDKLHIR